MNKFKPGDKVRCIRPATTRNYLKQGEIYTVAKVTETDVVLKEIGPEHWWIANRFELAQPSDSFFDSVEVALAFLKTKGEVKFTPKFEPIKIKLNDSYTAVVHKDYVEVGCQRFSFASIRELWHAVQKAQYHRSKE